MTKERWKAVKLSMWILVDWLEDYQPVIKILDGKPVIQGVRLLATGINTNQFCVCLGYARDYFESERTDLICVQGHDMLLLPTADLEQAFNAVFSAFDYFYNWNDQLSEIISQQGTLQQMLDTSLPVFADDLLLSNNSYMNSTCSFVDSDPLQYQYLIANRKPPQEYVLASVEEATKRKEERDAYILDLPSVKERYGCRNLIVDNHHLGWILLSESHIPLTKGRLQLLDILGGRIEEWLLHGENISAFTGDTKLFTDLLDTGVCSLDSLQRYLEIHLEWQPHHQKMLYILRHTDKDDAPLSMKKFLDQKIENCILFIYHEELILIVNRSLTSAKRIENALFSTLDIFNGYCAASYPFTNVLKLPTYYQQAETAMRHGRRVKGAINHCEDFTLQSMKDAFRKACPSEYNHPVLEQLMEYDANHNTELFETLGQYLSHFKNHAKSADALCIHRNTLQYRIQKIKDITEIDFDDDDVMLNVLLSYLSR